jgi:hypothetical protein
MGAARKVQAEMEKTLKKVNFEEVMVEITGTDCCDRAIVLACITNLQQESLAETHKIALRDVERYASALCSYSKEKFTNLIRKATQYDC